MTTRSIYDVTIADTTGMKRLVTGVNYAKNPRGVNSTGVTGAGGSGGAFSRSFPVTGGPLATAPTFIRQTITTVPASGTMTIILNGAGVTDLDASDAGRTLAVNAWGRTSKAIAGIWLTIGWFAGDTFLSSVNGPGTTPIAANTWRQAADIAAVVPVGATRVQAQVNFAVGNYTQALAGADTIDATAFMIYFPDTGFDGATYYDGDTTGAKWLGAPHASRSTKIVGIA